MSTPVKKTTKSNTGKRRSHHALKPIAVRYDKDGNPHLPHTASPATGEYRGRKVVNVAIRAARALRRSKKTS